jgi:DNA-binding phage protein
MAHTTKTKKEVSSFDVFLSDPKRKDIFEREHAKFLLSEFLIEEMEKNKISVRKLASQTGLSTSIIQNLKATKPANLTLKTILSLIEPFGYELKIQKGKKSYPLTAQLA